MKKIYLLIGLLIILLIPSFALGGDIKLSQDLNAKAFVVKSEKDGLWEKSLIVRFPERRRALSTTDGFIDAMAVVNHSAHPELWREVCEKMKTKDKVGGKVYTRKIRVIITATEAKTAAFEDLKVLSTYIKDVQATGTDSVIIVSGTSRSLVTYTGGHSKMGELIGKAVHEAVLEALIKQNGFKKTKED